MISIRVDTTGIAKINNMLGGMEKQVRFATALALTNTAKQVKNGMPAVMDRELDRPVPFTKNGMFITPARRDDLRAVVGFKDIQAKYLSMQIEGGVRSAGPKGIKLPGNITLNAFGNIPRGMIDKLKQAAQGGGLSSAIARKIGASRRKGTAPIELFYGKPTGRGWEKAPVGIYRRIPGTPGKLVPVILFEDTPARYRPRFKFYEAARTIINREWDKQFALAFESAMRSAR